MDDQINRLPNFLSIPQSGQIQDFIAKLLLDNGALDVFHVNLASNNTNLTDSSNIILDTEELLWIHNDSFSLDIDLYQQGTDKNEGDCGQMQANSAGTLDFDSNDCLVDLKPLCMRTTGSGIAVSTELEATRELELKLDLRKRRKRAKKRELVARQQLNRWRKRTRDKLTRSKDIGNSGGDSSKCLIWKDFILPGGIYLGNDDNNNDNDIDEDCHCVCYFKDKYALKRINLCLSRRLTGFVR